MLDAIFVDPRRNRDFYLAYTALIGEAARNERFNELNVTFRSIMNASYADLIRAGDGIVFTVDSVEEAAIGVRALIDGFFLQWLEEADWMGLCGTSGRTRLRLQPPSTPREAPPHRCVVRRP